MATNAKISSNVRAEMARRSCTQESLANKLGQSASSLSRRLSGRVPFSAEELDAIAVILNVPLDYLTGELAS